MTENKFKKNHYHLVSGTVMFRDPSQGEQAIASINLNTTLSSESQNVPARQIGKAQQALQMLMFQRLEDPNVQVIDVFIVGVSYLGLMTEKEFLSPPEGMSQQEFAGGQVSSKLN